MKRSLCLLAAIGLCLSQSTLRLLGITITASSASYADVSSAVSSAADGDTVVIPGGVVSWPSTLTISKSISLIGSGTNSTHLQRSGLFINVAPAVDKPIRVSGIWFEQTGSAATSFSVKGKIQSFRLDNCLFTGGNKRAVTTAGWVYGVIDHCTFLNCDIAIAPQGNEGSNDNLAWLRPLQMGTTNSLYIEDNLFRLDANAGDLNEQIYHQDSARTVTRYCTFDATGKSSPAWYFDAHGNQQIWNGDINSTANIRSTIGGEIYKNRFIKSQYRVLYLRGGSWLVFSNYWNSTATINLSEEEGWQTQFFNPLDTAWPAQDQITNTFIWANTNSSGLVNSVALPQSSDPTFIQNGRDYWMRPPQSGDAYYPYQPLVYPHPLVSGVSGGTVGQSIAVQPSPISFGVVAVSSTNTLSVTISNTGTNTINGSASGLTAPFGFVGSTSYSLAPSGSKLLTVSFMPTAAQSFSQTISFSGGNNTTASVTGSALNPECQYIAAASGTISPPFTVASDGTISQSGETTDPLLGGSAVYDFVVDKAEDYFISLIALAPSESANSVFINIDTEPINPDMIYDIPASTGFNSHLATWRSTGGVTPQAWSLSPGNHRLIIRGREPGVVIQGIYISTRPKQVEGLIIVK